MFTIQLQQLSFFAYHGLYEEEKLNGNNFEVNVDINFPGEAPVKELHQTIDYVTVYHLIQQRMQQPTALLETLLQDIVAQIYAADNRILSITITIKKLGLPIKDFKGYAAVSLTKHFK